MYRGGFGHGRDNLPEESSLCVKVHQRCIVSVEDHLIDLIKHVRERIVIVIPKGDGILLDSCEALLKTRALAKGRGARLRLVMTRRRRRHDTVEGANRFTRGLYTEPVCQIEGLNSTIKCGGAIVGTTGSVGESTGVDCRLRSIVVDIGGEGCIVGGLATSASPFAATTVAVALSMGGSVASRTAM